METYFGKKDFKETKNKMYLKYKNGFYVKKMMVINLILLKN